MARILGPGLHRCPRGAGSTRRYLLRPGRQPHVAGLEGRRRRGSQGFLRSECCPGRLDTAGLGWEQTGGRASEGRFPLDHRRKVTQGVIIWRGRYRTCPGGASRIPALLRPPPLARLLFSFAILTSPLPPPTHPFSVCGDCAPDGTCSLVRSPAYPGLGVVTGPRWSPVYDQRPSWCRTKKLGLMCLVPLENKRGSGVCNQGFNRPSYEKSRVPAWIQTQPFV